MTTVDAPPLGNHEVAVKVTTFAVCALPDGDPRASRYTIHVELRPKRGGWLVRHQVSYLSRDGAWTYHYPPAPHDMDAWRELHVFTEVDQALRAAAAAAPLLVVNGNTADQLLHPTPNERGPGVGASPATSNTDRGST